MRAFWRPITTPSAVAARRKNVTGGKNGVLNPDRLCKMC